MIVDDLAAHFRVTPQTIRRDMNLLSTRNLLERFHGGARPPSPSENTQYDIRRRTMAAQKKAIARAAANQIPNGASLFITIGTTTEAVAQCLIGHRDLRVTTNNLNVAGMLAQQTDFEVLVTAGIVRNEDNGIVGQSAIDLFDSLRVDYAIIGISGINLNGELLDFDFREVRAAQTVVRNADKVFLVADSSKVERKAMVRMGHFRDLDMLFTDEPLPSELATIADEERVEVKVVAIP